MTGDLNYDDAYKDHTDVGSKKKPDTSEFRNATNILADLQKAEAIEDALEKRPDLEHRGTRAVSDVKIIEARWAERNNDLQADEYTCTECLRVFLNSRSLVVKDALGLLVCRSCYMKWIRGSIQFSFLAGEDDVVRRLCKVQARKTEPRVFAPRECTACGKTVTKYRDWKRKTKMCRKCDYHNRKVEGDGLDTDVD